MQEHKLICPAMPNIPWQQRPQNINTPVWRYQHNPIIGRNPVKNVARIFNSAVVPFEDGFAGVFRAEKLDGVPDLYVGRSSDGIHWRFEEEKIQLHDENGEPWNPSYSYDPRVVKVEDTYYVIWCAEFHGPTLALAKTQDFRNFIRLENACLPFNRNGVLFPEKINGKYLLLSRPSDTGHTPFGDIFLSESPDLCYWGRHRHVMSKGGGWWQSLKIGGGAAPIRTDAGWLLIYHGVSGTCNGYVYSMGAALLDLEQPSIVRHRCANFILTPEEWYEEKGFVPNVVFPCAALCDGDSGRIAIYYGAADSYVGLAFCTADELIRYIKENDSLQPGDGEAGK